MAKAAKNSINGLSPVCAQLMECLRAYVHACPARVLPGIDPDTVNSLFALAHLHKALPVACDTLRRHEELFTSKEAASWKKTAKTQAVMAAYLSRTFCTLLSQLEKKGIEPIVLKGEAVRRLYYAGELRISADEDIYLPGSEAEACAQALFELGYDSPRFTSEGVKWDDSGVAAFSGSSGLHIELHRSLLPNNRLAASAREHLASAHLNTIRMGGGELPIRALSPVDELFYLVCHAAKHFASCGFGVRCIADIAAYSMRYYDDIDTELFARLLKESRLEGFARGVYAIAVRRLDYDIARFPMPFYSSKVTGDDMLSDCLSGGVYGKNGYGRAQSAKYTVAAASGGSRAGTAARAVFPSRQSLESEYPFVKKSVLLVPAAWAARIFKYLRSGRRDGQRGASIGRKRARLLKKYGMIPTAGERADG